LRQSPQQSYLSEYEKKKLKQELNDKQISIKCLIKNNDGNNDFLFKKINDLENKIKEYENSNVGTPM
ncbi:10631_t:CDS:2, partial [Scutellospora calospora]